MSLDTDSPNELGEEPQSQEQGRDFTRFLAVRVVAGVAFGVICIWGLWSVLGFFGQPAEWPVAETEQLEPSHSVEQLNTGAEETHADVETAYTKETDAHVPEATKPSSHEPAVATPHLTAPGKSRAKGVAFVEAIISALDNELDKRFWGWRRNDIVRFTDNVENMQLGVLEVVRRTSVSLAERISRYGVTDVIDDNLESAMNWFMIKPDHYWLPSAEDKYRDGLNELRKYAHKLETGEARFYTRTDNLIPLLISLVDLLGSCDENLVKAEGEGGSPVSWFKIDDYVYYAKGVATATGKILHAVRQDFLDVLQTRHGIDLLDRAIHACHVASELDPWLVTDAALDGILANHRANMAAPISHARYYLDALAKALST